MRVASHRLSLQPAAASYRQHQQTKQAIREELCSASSWAPSMAKIQPLPLPLPLPQPAPASPSPPSCSPSSDDGQQSLQKQQAEYTVWMKSLVFNGNGCTVYGADGGVAYRVDNYGCRGGREVFLMDHAGKALIRIRRKGRLAGVFRRRWKACWYSEDGGEETAAATPWFSVQRKKKNGAAVTMMMRHGGGGCGGAAAAAYTIVGGCAGKKSGYEVIGAGGAVAAAVGRKRTPAGVVLGDDVLTLTVGPGTDHLLALGLVVVCGLMNRCL